MSGFPFRWASLALFLCGDLYLKSVFNVFIINY
nr:MAG TPA: hypothetical protein [Caudoviricetes sp.]